MCFSFLPSKGLPSGYCSARTARTESDSKTPYKCFGSSQRERWKSMCCASLRESFFWTPCVWAKPQPRLSRWTPKRTFWRRCVLLATRACLVGSERMCRGCSCVLGPTASSGAVERISQPPTSSRFSRDPKPERPKIRRLRSHFLVCQHTSVLILNGLKQSSAILEDAKQTAKK
jgi:hypothetical protein